MVLGEFQRGCGDVGSDLDVLGKNVLGVVTATRANSLPGPTRTESPILMESMVTSPLPRTSTVLSPEKQKAATLVLLVGLNEGETDGWIETDGWVDTDGWIETDG